MIPRSPYTCMKDDHACVGVRSNGNLPACARRNSQPGHDGDERVCVRGRASGSGRCEDARRAEGTRRDVRERVTRRRNTETGTKGQGED